MYTSKKKIHIKILIGTVIIIISTIIILYIIFTNSNDNKESSNIKNDVSLNTIKQKVQDFQKGNAAANKNDLKCYAYILYDNLKLNVDPDDIYNILQSDGLKANNYKDGLLSSISILSKALDKNKCYVYKPLNNLDDYNNVSNYTIFNSNGLQTVFNKDRDPVGDPYTEYSFLTFIYFLSNLYKDNKEKTIIPLSNNLKLLNSQLIKANAFKRDYKTDKIIIPYIDDNIKINITTKNIPNKKLPSIDRIPPKNNSKITNTEKIYIPMPIFLDNRSQDKYNYFSNNVIYKDKMSNSIDSNTNSIDSNTNSIDSNTNYIDTDSSNINSCNNYIKPC